MAHPYKTSNQQEGRLRAAKMYDLPKRASGGRLATISGGYTAGAESGSGRLQKTHKAKPAGGK